MAMGKRKPKIDVSMPNMGGIERRSAFEVLVPPRLSFWQCTKTPQL
jgi:hypothetical protein